MDQSLQDDDEEEESVVVLDATHYTGQNLVKNHARVRHASSSARALTGMPLINYNKKDQQQQQQLASCQPGCYSPQQLAALQHQHLAFLLTYYSAALQHQQQQQQPQPQPEFVPRVLKPRRRRKIGGGRMATAPPNYNAQSSSSQASTPSSTSMSGSAGVGTWEISSEEERHFLPTDLLDDCFIKSPPEGLPAHGLSTSSNSVGSLSPIRPPSQSGGGKVPVRLTESLHQDPCPSQELREFDHPVLRKTYSWAGGAAPEGATNAFSLFPQTSESDLLCSVRNDLSGGDGGGNNSLNKAANNLEEALKSLSIEGNAKSSTRKF